MFGYPAKRGNTASVNRRINKKKSGYYPAVSTTIMLSSVAIMGSVLLIWASTSFSAQQQSIDNYYEKRSNAVKEAFVIEHVWFESAGPYINITLRNVGPIAVSIEKVTINSSTECKVGASCTLDGNTIIGIKEDSTIKVNYVWSSGIEYDIVVTTERGSTLRGVWNT